MPEYPLSFRFSHPTSVLRVVPILDPLDANVGTVPIVLFSFMIDFEIILTCIK
jgi:hypothetical protein